MIEKSWCDVSTRTIKSSWKKLWPNCMEMKGLEDSATETIVVNEIVSLVKSVGLDIDNDDVDELIKDYPDELTNNELEELQREKQELNEDISSEEEQIISSKEIQEICKQWQNIEKSVKKGIQVKI